MHFPEDEQDSLRLHCRDRLTLAVHAPPYASLHFYNAGRTDDSYEMLATI